MIEQQRRTRVLVVTDSATPSPALLRSVRARVERDDRVQFRLVVLNPARAELHLLHPERRDKAFEAECALLETLPEVELAAGGTVLGSVSVRHDPVEAIEETVLGEPVDEIILALPVTRSRWHHDLVDRVARFGVPVAIA